MHLERIRSIYQLYSASCSNWIELKKTKSRMVVWFKLNIPSIKPVIIIYLYRYQNNFATLLITSCSNFALFVCILYNSCYKIPLHCSLINCFDLASLLCKFVFIWIKIFHFEITAMYFIFLKKKKKTNFWSLNSNLISKAMPVKYIRLFSYRCKPI